MRTRVAIGAAVVAAGFSVGTAAAQDASFDCAKAAAPIERLICGDSELMRLDGELAQAWAARRAALTGDAQRALIADQRQWLAQRTRACGVLDKAGAITLDQRWAWAPCVAEQYRGRLAALGRPQEVEAPPPAASAPGWIHPLCMQLAVDHLFGEEGKPAAVPLARCNAGERHVPVSVEAGKTLDATEYFATGASEGWRNWFGYQPLGRLDNGEEAALVFYNGGGTGTFTSIVGVRSARDAGSGGTTITAERIVGGGDRCNGGINGAKLLDGRTIRYGVNVTPADFIPLAGGSDAQAGELASCAICCYAVAEFQRRVDGSAEDPLLFVTIEALDADDTQPDPSQICLDRVVRETARSFPATLSPANLKTIAERHRAQCSGR